MEALKRQLHLSRVSNEKLAAKVHARWAELDPNEKLPQVRTVAVEIGDLRANGVETYWRKRELALQALAEALGMNASDIESLRASSGASFRFERCSRMRPLLAGESPCPSDDAGGWLGSDVHDRLTRGYKTWYVVPHGGGKRLVAFWIRHLRPDVHIAEVATLSDLNLSDIRDDRHVLVRVDRPSLDDATVTDLLLRRSKSSACVLASFLPTERVLDRGWDEREFAPTKESRRRFVRWSANRMSPVGELRADELIDWLDLTDPHLRAYPTPGDVIPILDRCQRLGVPKANASPARIALDGVASILSAHTDHVLQLRGSDVVGAMIRARFEESSPNVPSTVDEWARRIAPETTARTAVETRGSKSKPKSEPARVTEATDPHLVVHALRAQGILCTSRSGGLDVAPWIRVPIEERLVVKAIESAKREWPLWATDSTRHERVEAALDKLPRATRVGAAAPFQESEMGTELVAAAAVEATFAAVCRWLEAHRPTLDDATVHGLQRLGVAQLRLVRALGEAGCLGPVTLPTESPRVRKEWFDYAWRFSFVVPRPDELDVDPGLVLPGWSAALAPDVDPRVLDVLWQLDPPMHDLSGVLAKFTSLATPHMIPTDLLVVIILDSEQRSRLSDGHWRTFFESHGAPEALCDRLRAATASVRSETCRAVLAAARGVFKHDIVRILNLPAAMLEGFDAYATGSEWDAIVASTSMWQALSALERMSLLLGHRVPMGFARAVFRRAAAHDEPLHPPGEDMMVPFENLGADDTELLVALVHDHAGLGQFAAARLWSVAPQRALAAAQEAARCASLAASPWFHMAPDAHLGALVNALEEYEGAMPDWAEQWLRIRLNRALPLAPRIYQLLGRARSFSRKAALPN